MLKKIVAFLFFIFCCVVGQSQDMRNPETGKRWCEGYLILEDGTKFEGFVKNNENDLTISFKGYAGDSTANPIRTETILFMEYFDIDRNTKRRFASLETREKGGRIETHVYEIIREFEAFAVVAIKGGKGVVSTPKPTNNTPYYHPVDLTDVTYQTEAIYFVDREGTRELYLEVEFRNVDALVFDYNRDIGKIINPTLFSKYVGENDWKKVQSYIKKNDIKLHKRDGFAKALEYYASLVAK